MHPVSWKICILGLNKYRNKKHDVYKNFFFLQKQERFISAKKNNLVSDTIIYGFQVSILLIDIHSNIYKSSIIV